MSKTKQKLDQNTIHRVLKLIRPYTGMVILTLTLALITVVTTLLAPVLSGKAVDMILGPGQVDLQALANCDSDGCHDCLHSAGPVADECRQ